MSNEPIPDEFGSWARLLPSPEEKKPAVKASDDPPTAAPAQFTPHEVAPSAKAVEGQPVIESTTDETATLAMASDEMFAEDEPLFALAASHDTVIAEEAAHEAVGDGKPADGKPAAEVATNEAKVQSAELNTVEKAVESHVADASEPSENLTAKTEISTASESVIVEKPAQHNPAEVKAPPQPAVDEKVRRPFRVKLRGSLLVLVRLPNKRTIQGSFHQLSTTGGVIHFEKPLDEKLEVELIFHLKTTTIRSKGQMLFPMWATQGWMQPFRFVGLAEDNRRVLDEGLKSFVGDLAKSTSAGA